MSVSRLPAQLLVEKGQTTRIELLRHLAPSTVRQIWEALPLSGRIAWYENVMAYFPVQLMIGNEKSRNQFRAGELGFMPSGSAICVFVKEAKTSQPVNPIGRLVEEAGTIENLPSGTVVIIRRLE